MKYWVYLRVSDKHQLQGGGYDRQRETVERWRSHQAGSVKFAGEFCDAWTGAEMSRPGLGELMVVVQEGDVVVVERPDRLARDLVVGELILDEFRSAGVRVVSAEADLDLTNDDDPTRRLVRHILSALAEYEKSSIVAKLRRARQRVREKSGRCEGAKPFGDLPGEEGTLDVILDMWRRGQSYGQIAEELNRLIREHDMHRPRRGARWNKGTIHGIVKARRTGP